MRTNYDEKTIQSLDWREHIRLRPGMYIGRLGDGSHEEDGIYMLVKEVIDNAVDEYIMGAGQKISVHLKDSKITVRDYGRGIPLGKVVECVSTINTGGKYQSGAFKKSVGLNGVGTKAVNALSDYFCVRSFRKNKGKEAVFSKGVLVSEKDLARTKEPDGTEVTFLPDKKIFPGFIFREDFLENQLSNYSYLNTGLELQLNEKVFLSKHGLLDLLTVKLKEQVQDVIYPAIHCRGEDIEIAFTHLTTSQEKCFSFVNGQFTPLGGTHQSAWRECFVKMIRQHMKDHFKKDCDPLDIRHGLVSAVSLRVEEPVFESQTKTKLGSSEMAPQGPSIKSFIQQFVQTELDQYFVRHVEVAKQLLTKIQAAERERKQIAGIKKLASERSRKANFFNRKLRDCQIHYNTKHKEREKSTIFITEGDSASGSITEARSAKHQAVFSLRGKPLNCYGLNKKAIYESEEFSLLLNALNIEESLDDLRYNKVVISTDADVDGMHIRLLIMTFFLQFYPELVEGKHIYILQTPLFRVRNKKTTHYCYSEKEKVAAIANLGGDPEITRFKGLGEISPSEFAYFIGQNIRLQPVTLSQTDAVMGILKYYMGKNTPERRDFIVNNLRVE